MPPRVAEEPVLGVPLALTNYEETLAWMDATIAHRGRGYLCVAAVHTVMLFQEDAELREAVLNASFTVPDGTPLVWAMNALGHDLPHRVYGPDLMEKACERAAKSGVRMYLYGGRNQGALVQLALNLRRSFPGLQIVGGYSPPFRELTDEETDAVADEINRSRADVVWVGIGAPKQEKWMAQDARPPRGSSAGRRRRGVRLPRRPRRPGPALDAEARPRVGVPPRHRAAAPLAALRALQPALRDGLCAAVAAPQAVSLALP